MDALRIVFLSVFAAVAYGILHDQVTARICVEYFTVGHPPLLATESPTLLGLGWGIVATWWVGLLLGIPLALCARVGSAPPLTSKDLVRPIGALLISMAGLAWIAGLSGYFLGKGAIRSGGAPLDYLPASRLPESKQVLFIACWFAHLASYLSGFLGGLVLCVWTVVRRRSGGAGSPGRASAMPDAGAISGTRADRDGVE